MKRKSLLTVFLPLLFLLPHPLLGDTAGTMTIMEDTELIENHGGNIIIGADDITLDCAGNMVSGLVPGSGIGVALNNRIKVTVKNCYVQDFEVGLAYLRA